MIPISDWAAAAAQASGDGDDLGRVVDEETRQISHLRGAAGAPSASASARRISSAIDGSKSRILSHSAARVIRSASVQRSVDADVVGNVRQRCDGRQADQLRLAQCDAVLALPRT